MGMDVHIEDLPEGWSLVKLKEVAKIRGNKRVREINKVALIPMELIPDSGIFADYRVVPVEKVKSSTYCEAGDILLAKITPSLENGKQGIVPFDIPNGFALATTEVFPIAPEEDKIDRFFLFYLLKFNKFRQKIIASMTGTTGRQ
ncbi:restriction endonuclease subunit S, partial [Thermococcus sp.]